MNISQSDEVLQEARTTDAFHAVVADGTADIDIEVGESHSVVVHGEAEYLPKVRTEVTDGVLEIWYERPEKSGVFLDVKVNDRRVVSPTGSIAVEVTMPALEGVTLHGSGDVRVGAVTADRFTATSSGSGDLDLAGIHAREATIVSRGSGDIEFEIEADQLAVESNGSGDISAGGRAASLACTSRGSGDIELDDLTAERVTARTYGSGDIEVHATQTLRATTDGSGDIRYEGRPEVTSSGHGSGDVRKR